jgi:hypothetical protein
MDVVHFFATPLKVKRMILQAASPPAGAERLRAVFRNWQFNDSIPAFSRFFAALLRPSLSALVFATQSPFADRHGWNHAKP